MDVFQCAAPHFRNDFANAGEFRHGGQHIYPPLTPGLEVKLRQLLHTSDAMTSRPEPDHHLSVAPLARDRVSIREEA